MSKAKLDTENRYAKLVARAWLEPDFKARLIATPAEVLREYGFDVPPGTSVIVVEDSEQVMHVALPASS